MKILFNVLCLFAVFLPFQFALNIAPGIDLAVVRVIVLGLFVFISCKSLIDKKFIIPINWQSIFLIAFFVLNIFSLFFADNLMFAIRKILFLTSIIPIYFVIVYILNNSEEKFRKFVKYLTWGGILSVFVGVIIFLGQYILGIDAVLSFYSKIGYYFWGQSFSESVLNYQSFLVNIGGVDYLRMSSLFPDPHNFALFAGIISFLTLSLFLISANKSKKESVFYGVISLICFLSVFLSFTRAAYLALGVSLVIVLAIVVMVRNNSNKTVIGVISALLFVVFLFSPAKDRFLDVFSREDGSNIERMQIFKNGLSIFKDNLLFGVGIGNAPLAYNENIDYRNPTNSHNTYLEIAIENGVFGLAAWCLLVFGTIIQLIKLAVRKQGEERFYVLGLIGSLLFFTVHSFFEVFLYSPINLSLVMIILAINSIEILNIKNQMPR